MTYGLDPEMFVTTSSGMVYSAHKLVGVTDSTNRGISLKRDGVAVELNTNSGCGCRDNLIPYIAQLLNRHVPVLESKRLEWSSKPMANLLKSHLSGAPEDVIKGGCNPDIDAYTFMVKSPEAYPDQKRYTGGHVHKQYKLAHPQKRYYFDNAKGMYRSETIEDWEPSQQDLEMGARFAKVYDIILGIPMVAALGNTFASGEIERRQFYGQAGSFRIQPHGFEYRVLSGRIMLSPALLWAVLGFVKNWQWNAHLSSLPQIDELTVQMVINNHDVVVARALWKEIIRPFLMGKDAPYWRSFGHAESGAFTHDVHVIDIMIEAEQRGINFKDDMKWNWGLYPGFHMESHKYPMGSVSAVNGTMSEDFWPQRAIMPGRMMEREPFVKVHPGRKVKK